jgi:8-oxo-dGTP pyrophosphatase MutT (NUDIX family)
MGARAKDWRLKPGVRVVLVDDAGRVLLLRRPDAEELYGGHWNLPGGGREANETPLGGALRELEEETGLTGTPTGASVPFTFPGGTGRAFLVRHPAGRLNVEKRESDAAQWFYPGDLPHNLMPPTAEIVTLLAGTGGDRPMADLHLTADRLHVEQWVAEAVRPWLEAAVKLKAKRLTLTKALDQEGLDELAMRRMRQLRRPGYEPVEGRDLWVSAPTGDDDEGEEVLFRSLVRARKMGMAEAARAILTDARAGQVPEGHQRGYRKKTLERLRSTARRTVRLVNATTEKRLAPLALEAEGADVFTVMQKLYDMSRAETIAIDVVAQGYAEGVMEVLAGHGYAFVYPRTMGDDKVCPVCRAREGVKMTIKRFLKAYPLHVRCRCYPHTSPLAEPRALNWRAKKTAKVIMKGLATMETSLMALRALTGEQPPMADLVKAFGGKADPEKLREIAKKRTRGPGGKFAAGKVTPEEIKNIRQKAGMDAGAPPKGTKDHTIHHLGKAAKRERDAQAAADAPVPMQAPGDPTDPKGPTVGPQGPKASTKGAIDDKNPQHLVEAANKALEQLRTLKPGTPEFEHVRTQYEGLRQAVRGWNKSKGESAKPKPVEVPPKPDHFDGELRTPRQFELAAAAATTKEDAIALGKHFEAVAQRDNLGSDYKDTWNEIKAAIAKLPTREEVEHGKAEKQAKLEGIKAKSGAPSTPAPGPAPKPKPKKEDKPQEFTAAEPTEEEKKANAEAIAAVPHGPGADFASAPPAEDKPKPKSKQPHEMTFSEYRDSYHADVSGSRPENHKAIISRALERGETVPDHVLDEHGGHGRAVVEGMKTYNAPQTEEMKQEEGRIAAAEAADGRKPAKPDPADGGGEGAAAELPEGVTRNGDGYDLGPDADAFEVPATVKKPDGSDYESFGDQASDEMHLGRYQPGYGSAAWSGYYDHDEETGAKSWDLEDARQILKLDHAIGWKQASKCLEAAKNDDGTVHPEKLAQAVAKHMDWKRQQPAGRLFPEEYAHMKLHDAASKEKDPAKARAMRSAASLAGSFPTGEAHHDALLAPLMEEQAHNYDRAAQADAANADPEKRGKRVGKDAQFAMHHTVVSSNLTAIAKHRIATGQEPFPIQSAGSVKLHRAAGHKLPDNATGIGVDKPKDTDSAPAAAPEPKGGAVVPAGPQAVAQADAPGAVATQETGSRAVTQEAEQGGAAVTQEDATQEAPGGAVVPAPKPGAVTEGGADGDAADVGGNPADGGSSSDDRGAGEDAAPGGDSGGDRPDGGPVPGGGVKPAAGKKDDKHGQHIGKFVSGLMDVLRKVNAEVDSENLKS